MKNNVTIITLIIICIITAVIIYSVKPNKQISIDEIKSSLNQLDLPTSLTCDLAPMELQWEYKVLDNPNEYRHLGVDADEDTIVIRWGEEQKNIFIYAVIENRHNLLSALMTYYLMDPKGIYQKVYPDIVKYDKDITGLPLDIESFQCASVLSTYVCSTWFYRAVYDNYYVFITEPGQECVDNFLHITQTIMSKIIIELAKVSN